MKFIHISDLHIGRRLNEYSLIEDQKYILEKIVEIVRAEAPDCVFIAGDVYDKTMPSAEAVSLLDDFLWELVRCSTKVFIVSGNHDSAERIAYGEKVFKRQGIYLSPVFDGGIEPISLEDKYGKVNIYLLPFVKPAHVKRFFETEQIEGYTDAIDTVIKSLDIDKDERNIMVAHQFVTGAERSESEEVNVGGMDNVEGYVFDAFDYVALGHIHTPQHIGRETMRYSGTPMKYSASEARGEKSVISGELKEKGNVEIRKIPLVPKRDFLDLKGTLEEMMKGENRNDYVRITLTDKDAVVDAYGKLKGNYPYMTELLFERQNKREELRESFVAEKSPEEQFGDFYHLINGKDMTDAQKETVIKLFEDIREGK